MLSPVTAEQLSPRNGKLETVKENRYNQLFKKEAKAVQMPNYRQMTRDVAKKIFLMILTKGKYLYPIVNLHELTRKREKKILKMR